MLPPPHCRINAFEGHSVFDPDTSITWTVVMLAFDIDTCSLTSGWDSKPAVWLTEGSKAHEAPRQTATCGPFLRAHNSASWNQTQEILQICLVQLDMNVQQRETRADFSLKSWLIKRDTRIAGARGNYLAPGIAVGRAHDADSPEIHKPVAFFDERTLILQLTIRDQPEDYRALRILHPWPQFQFEVASPNCSVWLTATLLLNWTVIHDRVAATIAGAGTGLWHRFVTLTPRPTSHTMTCALMLRETLVQANESQINANEFAFERFYRESVEALARVRRDDNNGIYATSDASSLRRATLVLEVSAASSPAIWNTIQRQERLFDWLAALSKAIGTLFSVFAALRCCFAPRKKRSAQSAHVADLQTASSFALRLDRHRPPSQRATKPGDSDVLLAGVSASMRARLRASSAKDKVA